MEFVIQRPWLALVFVALGFAEYIWRKNAASRGYDRGEVMASLGIALGQIAIKPLSGIVILGVMSLFGRITPWQFPVDDWRTWMAGFVVLEFTYYWFWATHAVHHSATQMVLPAAIRLGWTGVISGGWLFFAALVLLGFPPIVVATLNGINLAYQYGLHTEAVRRLGPLEWVFNTPSHHRAHHSREAEWLDCNFGGILIIFDRLFGTFVAEPMDRKLEYGLVHGEKSNNPFRIAFCEWRRLFTDLRREKQWQVRWQIISGPPG
jgi:sterol desaturase/sphingolipid hydroxylase (fatty acid hydroxylase superfamily)